MLTGVVRLGDRDEWLFTGRISPDAQTWAPDHAVFGVVTVPGAAFVELALTAGSGSAARWWTTSSWRPHSSWPATPPDGSRSPSAGPVRPVAARSPSTPSPARTTV
ncbi:hypothetical protein NKG94_02300 [Micromonospora sp. M12]